MKEKRIAIVRAGAGGLAAAMLLANRGFQVEVFEKADRIGGRNAEIALDDYRFDLRPTFLMMKYVLDHLFEGTCRSNKRLPGLQRDPLVPFRGKDLQTPACLVIARHSCGWVLTRFRKAFLLVLFATTVVPTQKQAAYHPHFPNKFQTRGGV
jgi:monoamine oxidase